MVWLCFDMRAEDMAGCAKCGEDVLVKNLVDGLCGYCAMLKNGGSVAGSNAYDDVLLTTEVATDLVVTKRFGIVASERIYGVNIFRDMFAAVRDIVGGANKGGQNVLRDARKEVLAGLKQEAYELGANAVIAVDVDYGEVSGGGKSMLLVAATGTAVIVDFPT